MVWTAAMAAFVYALDCVLFCTVVSFWQCAPHTFSNCNYYKQCVYFELLLRYSIFPFGSALFSHIPVPVGVHLILPLSYALVHSKERRRLKQTKKSCMQLKKHNTSTIVVETIIIKKNRTIIYLRLHFQYLAAWASERACVSVVSPRAPSSFCISLRTVCLLSHHWSCHWLGLLFSHVIAKPLPSTLSRDGFGKMETR